MCFRSLAGFHPGCFCSSLHSSFSLSIGFLPPPPARPDSSALMARKNPAGYKLLPLTDKLGLCAHRDLHSSRNCSAPFCRFMPPDNPVSEVCRELLWLQARCALWRTVSHGVLYRQVWAIQIMSNQRNWSKADVITDGKTSDDRLKYDAPELHASFTAKAVNTWYTCDVKIKNTLTLWAVVCNFEGGKKRFSSN